jgi:hypothetical protein
MIEMQTRNYHREIVEERDRLRAERDELLEALKEVALLLSSERGWTHPEKVAHAAIALAEEGKS